MNKQPVIRDERYYAVENASFRIGYLILAFGLLLLIVIRSIVYRESNWDLFALIVISSFAATIYQFVHKIVVFSWKWIYYAILAGLLAAIMAFLLGTLMR
jgi:hypothetical protein